MGVFGDVAIERLRLAKETVWLLDSDTQIRVLAVGASANMAHRGCISRLKGNGVRFFTTANLSDETREHLWFANHVIEENRPNSPYVIAAARGEAPFRKSNLFLAGFIRWQSAGNPCNWGSYLYQVSGVYNYAEVDVKNSLGVFSIEVVDLATWSGFSDSHYPKIEEYAHRRASIWDQAQELPIRTDSELTLDSYKKARPEAEAHNIVRREREGDYHIISEPGTKHPAWFNLGLEVDSESCK